MPSNTCPRLAVGGVIFDGEGVVLIRRAQPPKQGSWTLPGGRVELSETIEQALCREIAEETGLEVRVGPLLEVVELIGREHHYVILDYACTKIGGALRAGDDASDIAQVRLADLASYDVTAEVRRVIDKARQLQDVTGPTS
jgi:mutator protein MutT